MEEDVKTYQPGWDEQKDKKRRHHHHHHHHSSDQYTNKWGGWMKMRDKQAYYGLMFIVFVALGYGAFRVAKMYVDELRAMPMDDPTTEMRVDELRIHKVAEQDALYLGDSLAQSYQLDSIKHVKVDSRPPYRPPKREDTWYITKREWKDIWKTWKIWKKGQEQ